MSYSSGWLNEEFYVPDLTSVFTLIRKTKEAWDGLSICETTKAQINTKLAKIQWGLFQENRAAVGLVTLIKLHVFFLEYNIL